MTDRTPLNRKPVARRTVMVECVYCPRRASCRVVYVHDPEGYGSSLVYPLPGWVMVRGTFGPGADPDNASRFHRVGQAWCCPSCSLGLGGRAEPADALEGFLDAMREATDAYGVTWCKQPGCGLVADPAGVMHGKAACERCISREFLGHSG